MQYSGLFLQLLGIYIVVRGMLGRQRLFNHPSLADDWRTWVRKFPRGSEPKVVESSGTATLSLSSSNARLSVWRDILPEAPTEGKLTALTANVESLKTELAEISNKFQEEIRKLIKDVKAERQNRDPAVQKLKSQIEKLGAGEIRLEWTGVWWLIIGIILVTIPSEIVTVLKLL